jgi:glycosyltransferase involved in cell wall biosynthesis
MSNDRGISLSYVLTTFNKIRYLRLTLPQLVQHCAFDEEIIVIDGGSVDGTREYLSELHAIGKIQHFVSEKDFGESHGFNKGMLLAEGVLIKLISDDDAFHYPSIGLCKQFMLDHPEIHALNTSGGGVETGSGAQIHESTKAYERFFVERWLTTRHPFAHCGLGLMLRKTALPMLGLLNVGMVRSDAEYTLKITSIKINYAWFTGFGYVRILNSASNSHKMKQKISLETVRLNRAYGFDIDKIYQETTIFQLFSNHAKEIGWRLGSLRRNLVRRFKNTQKRKTVASSPLNFEDVLKKSTQWLQENSMKEAQFLR